jgi:hypothetical protein
MQDQARFTGGPVATEMEAFFNSSAGQKNSIGRNSIENLPGYLEHEMGVNDPNFDERGNS